MDLRIEDGDDGVPFIQLGKHVLRIDLEELDEAFRELSCAQLRESPEIVADALAKIRKLIKAENGLTIPLDDDAFLIKFLRPCKFYYESTFRLMKRYYKFKYKHPELSLNLMPVYVRHVYEADMIKFLPVRCDNGTRIMVANIGSKWNIKKVSLNDMFRSVMMALEVAMIEPKTQVAGVHVILDTQGLTLSHIWQFSPSFAKKVLDFVQQCTPIRLKGIHIVNQPLVFKMLFSIFKPFIGEKLKRRLFFHGSDRKSLHGQIPREYLPTAFDGTLDIPDCPGYLLADMFCRYEKEFELCNTIGYTMNKSVGEN